MTTATFSPDPLLVHALRAVAAACDGAHSEDGVGFNGQDTAFGRALAAAPAQAWTPGNARAAWRLLRKYRGQLADRGIDYDAITEPAGQEDTREVRWVAQEAGAFVLRFSYDPALVAAVRRLRGARWDPAGKAWRVPLAAAESVRAFAADHGFGAEENTWDVPEDTPPPAPAGRVRLAGDRLALTFDYDAEAVDAVRALPDRQWDSVRQAWFTSTAMVTPVRAIAARFGWAVDPEVAALPDVEVWTGPSVGFDGAFTLRFGYDRDLIARVREIPGATWDPTSRCWRAPAAASLEVFAFAEATGARVDDSAAGHAAAAREAAERVQASRAADADFTVPGLAVDLLPFQRAGVAYAVRALADGRGVMIADEQGLGKTYQGLATLEALGAYPAVVVCPALVKVNWAREAAKALPHRSVEVVGGLTARPRVAWPDITIVNYDVLHAWADTLPAAKAIVFDESHYYANPRIRRWAAVQRLIKRSGGHVINLTGTAATGRAQQLATQIRAMGRVEDVGGLKALRSGRPEALVAFNARLRATCFVRRLKADVLTELPPKRWADLVLPGEARAMAEYRRAEANLLAYLADKARRLATESGASDEEARRAAWQAAMRASAAEHLVAVTVLKKLSARAKMPAVREWLANFTDTGAKVIVFGWHTSVVDEVAETFAAGCRIQGGMPSEARQGAVDRFQHEPDQQVIACQIKAAGVGITLTAASDVLFVEQGWTPGDMEQAVDRAHRIGQRDSVTGWVAVTEGTIDEDIAALIAAKRMEVGAVLDGRLSGKDGAGGAGNVLADLVIRLAERGLHGEAA
ncbi:MAG: DEAD/DEAH box helicase [Actinomycetota bacterium]